VPDEFAWHARTVVESQSNLGCGGVNRQQH
jgi:hypothetical protein